MHLNSNVIIAGIRPEVVIGMMVAARLCDEMQVPFVVTSVTDGKHSATSLHYAGQAFDMRTRDMPDGLPLMFVAELKRRLPTDFDVILEPDHIHVEWQPKR